MVEKKLLKDKEKKEYGDDIGNSHGTVIIAERQRKGRGRHTEKNGFHL